MKLLFLFILTVINLYSLDIVAHRGYNLYPENSKESIKYALKKGYDGVEIDIQPLRNGLNFALIHDAVLTREVAYHSGVKNIASITKDEWLTLYKKQDGYKTEYKATILSEVLDVFENNAISKKQFLNIELKSPNIDPRRFYLKISPYLDKINIQVSSNYLFLLEKLRKLDSRIYLGYIFLPNSSNLKKEIDKKMNTTSSRYQFGTLKNLYNKYSSQAEDIYAEKVSEQYFKNLDSIEYKIGSNMGIHLDFDDVKKYNYQIKDALDMYDLKIYIYSIDKSVTIEDVKNYFYDNDLRLDGIITDEDKP